jgi:hypothetical protein
VNKLLLSFLAAILASAGAARAETFYFDVFQASTVASAATAAPKGSTSRAQALAEKHVRRLSGLDRLSIRQHSDKSSFVYAQAKARYDRLVASEQFGLLVAALERDPYLDVVGRSVGQ